MMNDNQSSYALWSWIVAIALAVILFWMHLTGRGGGACCGAEASAAASAGNEYSPAVTEAFNFSATASGFVGTGDSSKIGWTHDIDALKALLSENLTAEGDELNVTLSGEVDSEAIKQQKLAEAQAFFGQDVTINDKITVSTPVALNAPPPAAKLYFETGEDDLPVDAASTLEASIAWLNSHPESKAIISGYHDPTGDFASNQALAKERAESAYEALIEAGISATRIEMRKPESTQGDGSLKEARRVEVTVE